MQPAAGNLANLDTPGYRAKEVSQADTAYQAALAAVSTAERRSLLDYLR